jgi:hypothetical protein
MLGRLPRLLAAVTVAGLLVVAGARPAAADLGGQVDCKANPSDPSCVVIVINPGGGGSDGKGGGSVTCTVAGEPVPCFDPDWGWLGSDGCRFKADPNPPNGGTPPAGKTAADGSWYMRTCPKIGNRDESVDSVWLDSRDAPILGALITQSIAELRLPSPQIGISPAPPAPQVVYVPTWLWVDQAIWHARSATASVPGLSITAVATPTAVTWVTGDGRSVTCGKGTEWVPGYNPAAASPDCGHMYTTTSRSEGDGTYSLRATITWKITWSGGGATGTVPALTSASSMRVQVAETSVVNTR